MSVKLHKVTLFVVDADEFEPSRMDKLRGDCYHNGSRIAEVQTAEFDRPWDDDDPLNKTSNVTNRAFLESLVEGKPVITLDI